MSNRKTNQVLPAAMFVSDEIFEREVMLADGKNYTLHFKALSHVEFNKYAGALVSSDESVRDQANSRLAQLSVVTPEGKPAMTAAQADKIKSVVMRRILKVIDEINGFKDFKESQGNV